MMQGDAGCMCCIPNVGNSILLCRSRATQPSKNAWGTAHKSVSTMFSHFLFGVVSYRGVVAILWVGDTNNEWTRRSMMLLLADMPKKGKS